MADYWKSTPTYWCKFCTTYVRDTPVARTQHERTPRHTGNIQRSLRNLHNATEREARDTQRAKDEVARLNTLVSGAPAVKPVSGSKGHGDRKTVEEPPDRKATHEERRAQIAQLVEMGVAVPEEYRAEMALTGEWKTMSTRRIQPLPQREDFEEQKIQVEPGAESFGVRKRKVEADGDDEDEGDQHPETDSAQRRERPGWGTRRKVYKGETDAAELDIAALMASSTAPKKKEPDKNELGIKKEECDNDLDEAKSDAHTEDKSSAVVFKKRKSKAPKG